MPDKISQWLILGALATLAALSLWNRSLSAALERERVEKANALRDVAVLQQAVDRINLARRADADAARQHILRMEALNDDNTETALTIERLPSFITIEEDPGETCLDGDGGAFCSTRQTAPAAPDGFIMASNGLSGGTSRPANPFAGRQKEDGGEKRPRPKGESQDVPNQRGLSLSQTDGCGTLLPAGGGFNPSHGGNGGAPQPAGRGQPRSGAGGFQAKPETTLSGGAWPARAHPAQDAPVGVISIDTPLPALSRPLVLLWRKAAFPAANATATRMDAGGETLTRPAR